MDPEGRNSLETKETKFDYVGKRSKFFEVFSQSSLMRQVLSFFSAVIQFQASIFGHSQNVGGPKLAHRFKLIILHPKAAMFL